MRLHISQLAHDVFHQPYDKATYPGFCSAYVDFQDRSYGKSKGKGKGKSSSYDDYGTWTAEIQQQLIHTSVINICIYLVVYKFTLNYFFMFIEPIPLVLHHNRGLYWSFFGPKFCGNFAFEGHPKPLFPPPHFRNHSESPIITAILFIFLGIHWNSNSQRIIYLEIYRLSEFLSAVFIGMSQELYLFCYIVT